MRHSASVSQVCEVQSAGSLLVGQPGEGGLFAAIARRNFSASLELLTPKDVVSSMFNRPDGHCGEN